MGVKRRQETPTRARRFVTGLVPSAVFASLTFGWAATAAASDCTTATLNRNCEIPIDRENPVSPLPVRVTSQSIVRLVVSRRPLEQILFDVTLVDTVSADPLNAVFGAFIAPIRSFVNVARITPPPGVDVTGPGPTLSSVQNALLEINATQEQIERSLRPFEADAKRIALELRQFQRRPAGRWTLAELELFRMRFSCDVLGVAAPGGMSCGASEPLSKRDLALGQLDALDESIKQTIENYNKLSSAGRALLAGRLDDVVINQANLRASVASVRTARSALVDAAGLTNAINIATTTVSAELPIGGFAARTSRTATIKISAQDLISKATATVATVVVHWGGTRWEVSTGAVFSRVPSRSFQNAPIIENGVPKLDASGKISTRIVETITEPTIVPAVLAHYRLLEHVPARQGQRIAVLASAGVGVNPYSGSADIMYGGTFAYRGLMISPMWHRARDIRLTNGLAVNQELGSGPPPLSTERFWVTKFAIGVSYRIPVN
jgi:hypothetical protein